MKIAEAIGLLSRALPGWSTTTWGDIRHEQGTLFIRQGIGPPRLYRDRSIPRALEALSRWRPEVVSDRDVLIPTGPGGRYSMPGDLVRFIRRHSTVPDTLVVQVLRFYHWLVYGSGRAHWQDESAILVTPERAAVGMLHHKHCARRARPAVHWLWATWLEKTDGKAEPERVKTPKVKTPKVKTPKVKTPKVKTPKVAKQPKSPLPPVEATAASPPAPMVDPSAAVPTPPVAPLPPEKSAPSEEPSAPEPRDYSRNKGIHPKPHNAVNLLMDELGPALRVCQFKHVIVHNSGNMSLQVELPEYGLATYDLTYQQKQAVRSLVAHSVFHNGVDLNIVTILQKDPERLLIPPEIAHGR